MTPRLDEGGVERLTLDVSNAVARAGGRSLVASRGGGLEAALLVGGGVLARLPVHARNPLVVALNAARLARLIKSEAVSLVHVRSRAPAFSALWAARATRTPIVATYHGIYSARSSLKRWYNGVMTRADVVIANSSFTRAHIIAQHRGAERKIVVIPEGIDTSMFDPATVSVARIAALRQAWGLFGDPPRRVILLPARLTGWKGQRLMIEVLARMSGRAAGDAVLILAGQAQSPHEARALTDAAVRAGVAGRVRLVGAVADMPAAYALADLVVAPSTEPESFGRCVAEAGAMQRPVLAAALGGVAETVLHGETGWLAPTGDASAWATAVQRALAQSPAELARIGRAARQRVVSRYGLEAMCDATFALYCRLVEARTR